jgi:hypothetical protein
MVDWTGKRRPDKKAVEAGSTGVLWAYVEHAGRRLTQSRRMIAGQGDHV